jgi:hypothetical protein
VAYTLHSKKLLDHEFELKVWPGPPDEEGYHQHAGEA